MPGDAWDWAGDAEPADAFDWAGDDTGPAPRMGSYVAAPGGTEGMGTGPDVGSDTVPEHYRETGRRELVLPEVDISVDPRGERPDVVRERGQATEIREIGKDPEYLGTRDENMRATISRQRAQAADDPTLARTGDTHQGRALPFNEGPREELLGPGTDYLVPDSIGGRELPSQQSVRRATRAAMRGNSDLGSILNVLLPTENTDSPIIGYDLRDRAPAYGASGLFGATDELIGLIRGDEARARDLAHRNRAREQAPGSYAIGQQAENIPLMLLPGGQGTALERMAVQGGYGLGTGALRGFMENDEGDVNERLNSAAGEGVNEALLSAGTQGAGELAAPAMDLLGRGLRRVAGSVDDASARAALQARGLPSSYAPRTRYGRHIERLGGPREVARMLNQERIGGRMLPNPADVPESLQRLDSDVSRQFEGVMDRMRNEQVPMRPFVQGVEDSARGLEALETGPANRAAQGMRADFIEPRLEELPPDVVGPRNLRNPAIPFDRAHALRQSLDRARGAFSRSSDPAAESAAGAAEEARDVLNRLMNEATDRAGTSNAWQAANRRHSLERLLAENSREGGGLFAPSSAEAVGTAMGGPLAGQGARLQQGLMNRYGPALRMRGLDALSAQLHTMGPAFQDFARVLDQAARRGSTALAAAHLMLQRRSPEYRAAVERMQNEEQE